MGKHTPSPAAVVYLRLFHTRSPIHLDGGPIARRRQGTAWEPDGGLGAIPFVGMLLQGGKRVDQQFIQDGLPLRFRHRGAVSGQFGDLLVSVLLKKWP